MRWTQTFIPTLKEVPAEAEIPGHQLMLRSGMIRQLMAGAYTFMPLGYRSVRKVSQIVREEMDRAGAIELFMPALQPIELFERTGRKDAFGNVLFNFESRRGDRNLHFALGPTHEEVITDLISREIKTFRQLPLTLYQIQTKFRNEERPRFGVLRTSEFLMKDAYSFGTSLEQLNEAYDAMYNAYCRIFERCGLEYIPVEAESGPIGGDASHEFMAPADNGEDFVVRCSSCGYAANQERADTGRSATVPPAQDGAADPEKVDTPNAGSIEDVSAMLKADPATIIKTLIYMADGKAVAVLIRGDHEANEGKIRRALDAADVALADEATIERVTGAPVGFAGPVGIDCDILVDHDIGAVSSAITGANEKDAHLTGVIPGTHFQFEQTHDLRNADAGDKCPRCDDSLEIVHGIEVGHVFKLGTKYSESLDATYLDSDEKKNPIIMGCYGIGVSRIVAAAIEQNHDDKGIIWPYPIAPFHINIICLDPKRDEILKECKNVYEILSKAGHDVLLDDRDIRAGVKFGEHEMLGIPFSIVIGPNNFNNSKYEFSSRTEETKTELSIDEIKHILEELK